MSNENSTILLIAHNLIFEIINIVRKASTEFLYQERITKEEFNQIFETFEISLCRIADDIAILLDENIFTSAENYERELDLATINIKSAIESCENFSSLNLIVTELVKEFNNIKITKGQDSNTSQIFEDIESICK